MKKIAIFVLFAIVLFGCANPVVPTLPDASPSPLPSASPDPIVFPEAPIPDGMSDNVRLAKYIRLPGSVVSRGMLGAFTDPDESKCTESGTTYIFYDDNSIVQYIPNDGAYQVIKQAVRISCEVHNQNKPSSEHWDYIAVDPPLPPPPVYPDITVPAGQVWFQSIDGSIEYKQTAEDALQWQQWKDNIYNCITSWCETLDRNYPDNAPHRYVYGPDPVF